MSLFDQDRGTVEMQDFYSHIAPFKSYSTGQLKSLFPFTNNLNESSDIVYNYLDEFERYGTDQIDA